MHKHVMIVEDDNDISALIKHSLEKKGYIVFVAENGREALEKLKLLGTAHPPCLILCDLNMPVMNGWELIEILSKNGKFTTIPLVIHSAEKITPVGYPFLEKPMDVEALLALVEKYCGKSNTNR